jgi:hypothetical protein
MPQMKFDESDVLRNAYDMRNAERAEIEPTAGITSEASASLSAEYIDTSAMKKVYAARKDIATTSIVGR